MPTNKLLHCGTGRGAGGVALVILFLAAAAGSRAVSGADDNRTSDRISLLPASGGRPVPTVVRTGTARPDGRGAGAVPGLANGGFSAGLDGWRVSESGGGAAPGGVRVEDGRAVIAEGDSFLVTLEQAFTVPEGAAELSFMLLLEPGFDRSAASIPDAFEVSLLDAGRLPVLSAWDPLATSSFNLTEDGSVRLAPEVAWDGATVRFDLRGLPAGLELTLFFDLIGADGDTAGGLQIDGVAIEGGLAAGSFVRGDHDGDGALEPEDAAAILAALLGGGPLAGADCLGEPSADAADANDNEWLTLADYQAARAAAAGGPVLPAPSSECGRDPDDAARGFDAVDPAYRIAAGELELLTAANAESPKAALPVLVEAPGPVTALTLVLEFDAAALTPFDPAAGDPAPLAPAAAGVESAYRVDGGRMVIALWAAAPTGDILGGAPGGLRRAAVVSFHLARFQAVRPFRWIEELESGGVLLRATVVDGAFADHHPQAVTRDHQFVRGNSNGDGAVNISDPSFTLGFLFLGGPEPRCLDAADANNDSLVNIADPSFTLNFLFLGGPAIPAPYPECGIDAGPADLLGCAAAGGCEE